MNLVEFESYGNKRIYINPEKVSNLYEDSMQGYSWISFGMSGDEDILVKGSLIEVKRKLEI